MGRGRSRGYRAWAVVSLVIAGVLTGIGSPPAATADVTAVRGSAFGYLATNITIFNGAQAPVGPTPTATLPANGGPAVTNTAATGLVKYGPATLFSSGPLNVSTQGALGAGGAVTSAATIQNVNTSGSEVFTAAGVSSRCSAGESGVTGSTTVTTGTLRTSEGNPNVDGDDVVVPVPASPAPNTSYNGMIEGVGDTFRMVFNEQVTNSDGSITVTAAHLYLLGPTAKGDLLIAQSVCGVTAVAATTTTTGLTTTTTTPGATTTTTAPTTTTSSTTTTSTTAATTTTTVPTTTTTTATTTGVAGGAYGYFVTVGLFGGAPATRGPAPTVSLPAGGSAAPVTGTAPDATAQFGPAIIFSSGRLDVSTQGVAGGTVTSSATVTNVNRSGQEQLTAASVSSRCSSSSTGQTGSATVSAGNVVLSQGANFDSTADDTVVQLPSDPAPNTSYNGKLENVGDTFRVVLNEQVRGTGSITVNAVHLFLLGPTAVGELIVGQSRCATTAVATGTGGTGGGGQTGGTGGGTGGGGLAGTGSAIAVFVALAMLLVMAGWSTMFWAAGVRWRHRPGRHMPWPVRGPLR